MNIYNYNDNGIFIGMGIVQYSELDKSYIIPRNATEKEPIIPDGKLAKFDNNEWIYIDDNTGVYYNKQTGIESIVKEYDFDVSGLTKLKPNKYSIWDNDEWIDDINKVRESKILEIDIKTSSIISEGLGHSSIKLSMSANAQINLLALQIKIDLITYPYSMTTMDDNKYFVVDQAEMQTIIDNAFAHKETAIKSGQHLKSFRYRCKQLSVV